jgi:hypothetical protein
MRTLLLLLAIAQSGAALAQAGTPVANSLNPLPPGGWSLVVIPDTQDYSKSQERMRPLDWTLGWIASHQQQRNIQAVVQVGDVVNDNEALQWQRVRSSVYQLPPNLPFFFAQGNHDVGDKGLSHTRDTLYNDFFSVKSSTANSQVYKGNFEYGRYENAFYEIPVGKETYLFLILEFAPRDSVLEWANRVVSNHSQSRVILVTHEFMDEASRLTSSDGLPQRSDSNTYGNGHNYELRPAKWRFWEKPSINNGSEIWNKLVSRHSNFEFVFSGHYDDYQEPYTGELLLGRGMGKAYRSDMVWEGNHPTRVHQFMVNSQWIPSGGDGWLLMMDFDANGKVARAQTYSPWLEANPSLNTSPDVFAEFWELLRAPFASAIFLEDLIRPTRW